MTALRVKPFVILAGISGTGKTRLASLVAEATGAGVTVVPVRPDWTDSSDLLGYERLNGDFVPGRLLEFCKSALAEPDRQFFFVLDEMNIARVEYYFADVLSVMEGRNRVDGRVVTSPLLPSAPTIAGTAWGEVFLPSNVSIVGTVNMDETTHGFSRKVLDRAFVLELSDVDLGAVSFADESPTEPVQWAASDWAPEALRVAELADHADPQVTQSIEALVRANEALAPAQLQVGYRVRDEVALFCRTAEAGIEDFVEVDQTPVAPLDLCLSMKILPRLQGGGAQLRSVLDDLSAWLDPASVDASEPQLVSFPRAHARVAMMKERLDSTGFTAYWY